MKKQNKTKTIVMLMVFSVMFWINGYGATYHWVGSISNSNWSLSSNWLEGVVPGTEDSVIFESVTRDCTIDITITVSYLYLASDYTGLFNIINPIFVSGDLYVDSPAEPWINSSSITFNGTGDQTITINDFFDLQEHNFNNLIINKPSGNIILGNNINVDNIFDNQSESLIQDNGYTIFVNGNPLPIELLSFDAVANANSITILWTTASEENNDYFVIEKSKDCSLWNEIDRIDGAGNSQTIIHYSIVDTNPWIGISYYRLTQVDYDGNYETFGAIALGFYETNLLVYPNPAQNIINLPDCAKIFDQQGRMILLGKPGENDISKLPKGLYHVMIHNISQTFIKQ